MMNTFYTVQTPSSGKLSCTGLSGRHGKLNFEVGLAFMCKQW